MKCAPLPSRLQLEQAYSHLQWSQELPSLKELVLWAQWSRFDARLAEIIVRFLARKFHEIHPLLLWEENLGAPQPQALAVLVDFARTEARQTLSASEIRALAVWSKAVLSNLPKAPTQLFFLPEGTPNPKRDRFILEHSLRPYLRWGFLGQERLGNGKVKENRTLLDRATRKGILVDLLRHKASFTVEDYMIACNGCLHRRTAERDLIKSTALEKSGHTRSTVYRAKRKTSA